VATDQFVIALTTLPADGDVETFAQQLVEEKLAACVSILPPMRSIYRWKGAVERETERQIVIKTTRTRLPALEARLKTLHPYELPEWIVLGAEASAAYGQWVIEMSG